MYVWIDGCMDGLMIEQKKLSLRRSSRKRRKYEVEVNDDEQKKKKTKLF